MLLDALEGHAVWSAVYDDAPNPLLSLEQRVVSPWLGDLAGRMVVDVACGTGRWTRFAEEHGARAVGVDFCAPMVIAGLRHNGCCLVGDAIALPVRNRSADLTICAFAAGYIDSLASLLNEMARITRPGGAVVITDVHPGAIGAGWRRAFRRDGQEFEIRHREYTVEEVLVAARATGLQLERLAEPCFGEPERAVFRRAGRESSFASMRRIPAVAALLWRRL